VRADEIDGALVLRTAYRSDAVRDGREVEIEKIPDRVHLIAEGPAILHAGEAQIGARWAIGRSGGPAQNDDADPVRSG
jgi:hypothetical protein